MSLINITNGTLGDATQVMDNFDYVLSTFNGNETSPYIESGTSGVSPSANPTSVSVIFDNEFDSIPTITATQNGENQYVDNVRISSKSTTGFTISMANNSGSGTISQAVDWIAIGTRTR